MNLMAKENWFARPLEEQEGVFVDYKQFDVKKQLTASQFQYEFEAIPNRVNYDSTQKNNEDQSMFLLKTGIDMLFVEKNKNQINIEKLQSIEGFNYKGDFSFLNDKVVVDAGCGNGRFAEIAAKHCKSLICLDIGGHIKSTKKRLSKYHNITYVQCDLANIPLINDAVDFVYSIGVIHHTPKPGETLKELSRITKRNGSVSIWVYPPEYWGNFVKRAISKRIRKKLLQIDFAGQVSFIRKYLMPIGRFQIKIENMGLKYLFFPFFMINVPRHIDENEMLSTTIDYYLPQYIFTYKDKELEKLFKDADLTYKKLIFNTSAIGRKT